MFVVIFMAKNVWIHCFGFWWLMRSWHNTIIGRGVTVPLLWHECASHCSEMLYPVRSSLVQFTDIKFKQLINEHITLLQVDIVNYRPWLVSKESVEFIIYIHCILGGVYQAQGHKILKLQCLLCQDNSWLLSIQNFLENCRFPGIH